MDLDKLITPRFLRFVNQAGAAMIFLVAFSLFFNYYDVFSLDNIPIPGLTVGLWIYLIINAGIATPFHYLKKKSNEAGFCPKCGRPLEITPKFHCEKCGDLEFKNNK